MENKEIDGAVGKIAFYVNGRKVIAIVIASYNRSVCCHCLLQINFIYRLRCNLLIQK